jgi:aminocarboxymuconate-semialdehyde decarboxylase
MMKRIDLHSHVIPETIVQAMRANPVYNTRIEEAGGKRVFVRGKVRFDLIPEFYDAQAKLESMDRKGLDVSVISPGPQSFFYNLGDADLAATTAQLVNKGVAEMCAKKPDRLRGMATLPMQHPDAAIVELERVVLGTDSPFDMGEEQPVERLEAVPGLTQKEREDVCYRSALALFGGQL